MRLYALRMKYFIAAFRLADHFEICFDGLPASFTVLDVYNLRERLGGVEEYEAIVSHQRRLLHEPANAIDVHPLVLLVVVPERLQHAVIPVAYYTNELTVKFLEFLVISASRVQKATLIALIYT